VYAAAMVLFAFGEAFRTGTHKALILEYLKLNGMAHLKVDYYGRTRAASQLGSAVNALIAGGLVFYSGNYRYVFVASVVPYLVDLVNLATYPKELDGELTRTREQSVWRQFGVTIGAFGQVFRDTTAMRTVLNSSGFDAFFKATKEYLQPILEAFAIALPLFVALEETRRSALIVGIVYSVIYLLTSYASRSAADLSRRLRGLAPAVNWTFTAGAASLVLAGVAARLQLNGVSIVVFLALYVLHNLRRPMTVALVSDQISHRVMAAGLSAESQLTTLLAAALAPLLGGLADRLGVGSALALVGVLMVGLSLVLRVRPWTLETSGARTVES
jgi:hypothetical protein